MSTHRIVLDRDLCSGFGACVDVDPASFGLGSDGIAVARVGSADGDAVAAAARACPMGAIQLLDADAGAPA